jgi:hypothetical protein
MGRAVLHASLELELPCWYWSGWQWIRPYHPERLWHCLDQALNACVLAKNRFKPRLQSHNGSARQSATASHSVVIGQSRCSSNVGHILHLACSYGPVSPRRPCSDAHSVWLRGPRRLHARLSLKAAAAAAADVASFTTPSASRSLKLRVEVTPASEFIASKLS